MDTQEALSFAAAAPFVFLALMLFTHMVPVQVPVAWNPLISFILTTAWGIVLVVSDLWSGSIAVFIVTDLTVTYAVIGLRRQASDATVPILKLSGQNPPTQR